MIQQQQQRLPAYPTALPNVSYIQQPGQQGATSALSSNFSSPMAFTGFPVNQNVTIPNNTGDVSVPQVSGREASIQPFGMQSPASQIFSAPGATWGQYMAAQNTPSMPGANVDARLGSMLGNTPIKTPLPKMENGSGLQKLISLLGGLAPLAIGGLNMAGGPIIQAIAKATGGKSTSTGGAGGTANVGPINLPAQQQYYQQQALNPDFGAYQRPISTGLGWTTGGGNLTFGGPVAGYGGGGGVPQGDYEDPGAAPFAGSNSFGTNSLGSNTPGQLYAGSQPNMTTGPSIQNWNQGGMGTVGPSVSLTPQFGSMGQQYGYNSGMSPQISLPMGQNYMPAQIPGGQPYQNQSGLPLPGSSLNQPATLNNIPLNQLPTYQDPLDLQWNGVQQIGNTPQFGTGWSNYQPNLEGLPGIENTAGLGGPGTQQGGFDFGLGRYAQPTGGANFEYNPAYPQTAIPQYASDQQWNPYGRPNPTGGGGSNNYPTTDWLTQALSRTDQTPQSDYPINKAGFDQWLQDLGTMYTADKAGYPATEQFGNYNPLWTGIRR